MAASPALAHAPTDRGLQACAIPQRTMPLLSDASEETASRGRPTSRGNPRWASVQGRGFLPTFLDTRQVFRSCKLLKDCSDEFLRCLEESSGPSGRTGTVHEADVKITDEGVSGHSLFIVHRGCLEAHKNGALVGYLGPGSCFDASIVLGIASRRLLTVRSVTLSHLWEITASAFALALLRCPNERYLFEAFIAELRDRKTVPQAQAKIVSEEGETSFGNLDGAINEPELTSDSSSEVKAAFMMSVDGAVGTSVVDIMVLVDQASWREQKQRRRLRLRRKSAIPMWPKQGVPVSVAEAEAAERAVKASLRMDALRGYRIPEKLSPRAEQGSSSSTTHANSETPVDLGLLPPIDGMSPLQKRVVQRHLESKLDVEPPAATGPRARARAAAAAAAAGERK
eukprot:TRINITY_DN4478_c2_g1_i1.p1 TRINITY_DN4478_c2_g1~~TRINITY_DN4478_c2_g1_i1.p1  ORF type:complete len:398 (+),score=49.95 TRINITY_DN4478_c2_g1_i1:118-1311(+)